jgi:hypothetical protein
MSKRRRRARCSANSVSCCPAKRTDTVDWSALSLSLQLAALTILILLPVGVVLGRWLAFYRFHGRSVIEALLALPLVLPPTVLGYYLLVTFGGASPIGQAWQALAGHSLLFSFEGLLIASLIVNLPFAVQPMQRGFEAIPADIREAARSADLRRRYAVQWSRDAHDKARGYEIGKGQFLLIEDAELEAIEIESTHTIDIIANRIQEEADPQE